MKKTRDSKRVVCTVTIEDILLQVLRNAGWVP